MKDILNEKHRFISPIIEESRAYRNATPEEKVKLIKRRFNLTHGKGKRKKK